MNKPGFVRGRHFTAYASEVRKLRKDGQDEAAEELLLRLVSATEEEAKAEGWCVAPWYYGQLAMLYAEWTDHASELAVLERYAALPEHQGGNGPLLERLRKARERSEG
jgi:hypothetical protein